MTYILSKVRSGLYIVKKIKLYLNKDSLNSLYRSFMLSHILYCIILWYRGHKSVVGQQQRSVYCTITILIFNLNPRYSAIEIITSQKLLSINQLFIKETSKIMF